MKDMTFHLTSGKFHHLLLAFPMPYLKVPTIAKAIANILGIFSQENPYFLPLHPRKNIFYINRLLKISHSFELL